MSKVVLFMSVFTLHVWFFKLRMRLMWGLENRNTCVRVSLRRQWILPRRGLGAKCRLDGPRGYAVVPPDITLVTVWSSRGSTGFPYPSEKSGRE